MHPLLLRLWIFARLALALPPSSCLTGPLILSLRFQAPKLTSNIHRYNIHNISFDYVSCQNFKYISQMRNIFASLLFLIF
ncbi:hypothetical protein DsansV1_C11g0113801 [Dioscorea sansibarensis]